jgi:hypothetical protein
VSRARVGVACALVVAVLAAHAAIVLHRADPALLNGDTAQLLSSGLNLLSGRGYATDAVFFANQFAHVPLPAPQTVWPPGLAVMLAGLVSAGMSPYAAALALSLAGFSLVVALTGALAVSLRLGASRAAAAAGCVASTSLFGVLAVRGFGDAAFVAATLASALLLVRATHARRPLSVVVAAGALAALAFSIRYAGVAWIAAGAVGVLAPHGLRDPRRAAARVLAFCALPALAVAAALGRNLALTGTATGAPVLGGEPRVVEVVRQFHWSVLRLLGAFDNVGEGLVEASALGVLGMLAWRAISGWRRNAASRVARQGPAPHDPPRGTAPGGGRHEAASRFVALALAYGAATAALLTHQAFSAYPGFVQPRYLLPLLPFALLTAVLAEARVAARGDARPGGRGAPRRSVPARGALRVAVRPLALACFVAGQVNAGAAGFAMHEGREQAELAARLSAGRIGEARLLDRLVRETSRERPLTSGDVQFLTGLHGLATVSLPGEPYSDRTWDEAAVRTSMARSGSCLLLLHAARADRYADSRLPFFAALLAGRDVDWLEREHAAAGVALYRASWCAP